MNGIQRNLTGGKIVMSSTKFVFFELIGKNKMATSASDWLRNEVHEMWRLGPIVFNTDSIIGVKSFI